MRATTTRYVLAAVSLFACRWSCLSAQENATTGIQIFPEPLWPCYSVKFLQENSTQRFRYVPNSRESNPECIFTIQGPPNASLSLQLLDVVVQKAGPDDGNCYNDAIRVYDFKAASLILLGTVCKSLQAGPILTTSANMALLTTTLHYGQFVLQAFANSTTNGTVAESMEATTIA